MQLEPQELGVLDGFLLDLVLIETYSDRVPMIGSS